MLSILEGEVEVGVKMGNGGGGEKRPQTRDISLIAPETRFSRREFSFNAPDIFPRSFIIIPPGSPSSPHLLFLWSYRDAFSSVAFRQPQPSKAAEQQLQEQQKQHRLHAAALPQLTMPERRINENERGEERRGGVEMREKEREKQRGARGGVELREEEREKQRGEERRSGNERK